MYESLPDTIKDAASSVKGCVINRSCEKFVNFNRNAMSNVTASSPRICPDSYNKIDETMISHCIAVSHK